MNKFLSPYHPLAIWALFIVIGAISAGGRFLLLDGGMWTTAAIIGLAIVLALLARNWPAKEQLGMSFSAWLRGGVLTGIFGAVIVATCTTASAVAMQARSPYYMWYDRYLIASGDRIHLDTNGEPYLFTGAGQDAGSVALTFMLPLVVALFAIAVGLALGLIAQRTRYIIGFLAALLGILALVVIATRLMFPINESPEIPHPITTAWLQILFLIVCGALMVTVSTPIISRVKKRAAYA